MTEPLLFTVIEIESAPANLEPGKLYISEEYALALHLCAVCNGSKVVMPINRDDNSGWDMHRNDDGTITFSPSILQGGCNHHYFIENNRVRRV